MLWEKWIFLKKKKMKLILRYVDMVINISFFGGVIL